MQRFLRKENNPRAQGLQHRCVTDELNCTPQPFIRADKNGLAFDIFLSSPHGLRKLWIAGCARMGRYSPSRLAPLPAGLEITVQQLNEGDVPVGSGVFRLNLFHMTVQHERFVELVKFSERESLVVESPHEAWSQTQRPIEPFDRLLVAAELLQSRSDVVTYVGIGRVQRMGPPVVGQRFLKSI